MHARSSSDASHSYSSSDDASPVSRDSSISPTLSEFNAIENYQQQYDENRDAAAALAAAASVSASVAGAMSDDDFIAISPPLIASPSPGRPSSSAQAEDGSVRSDSTTRSICGYDDLDELASAVSNEHEECKHAEGVPSPSPEIIDAEKEEEQQQSHFDSDFELEGSVSQEHSRSASLSASIVRVNDEDEMKEIPPPQIQASMEQGRIETPALNLNSNSPVLPPMPLRNYLNLINSGASILPQNPIPFESQLLLEKPLAEKPVEEHPGDAKRLASALGLATLDHVRADIDTEESLMRMVEVFERSSLRDVEEQFEEIKRRMELRKNGLIKEVKEKSELIRANISSKQQELSKLLEQFHAVHSDALHHASEASFNLTPAQLLRELENLHMQYAKLQTSERCEVSDVYSAPNIAALFTELSAFGHVPEVRSVLKEKYDAYTDLLWQSHVITEASQVTALGDMLNTRGLAGKLAYRGSRDGFNATEFHKRCDGIASTLTLIRVKETGNVIAAYTLIPNESCDAGGWLVDPTGLSFLATLNPNQLAVKLINTQHERALYVRTSRGPMFGGTDLALGERFDEREANSCQPSAYGSNSRNVRYDASYLAGVKKWTCDEIEVFALSPNGIMNMQRSSNILRMSDLSSLHRLFGTSGIHVTSTKLLYRGSRDGFTPTEFRKRCTETGPTITLVRVEGTRFVFGIYSAVAFPAVPRDKFFVPMTDVSMKSFVFSLVNGQHRPLKFRMRSMQYALYGHSSHGPVFGGSDAASPDIILGVKDETALNPHATLPFNHPRGNSINTPNNFLLDETFDALRSSQSVVHDRRLLTGRAQFGAAEIEVFQCT